MATPDPTVASITVELSEEVKDFQQAISDAVKASAPTDFDYRKAALQGATALHNANQSPGTFWKHLDLCEDYLRNGTSK